MLPILIKLPFFTLYSYPLFLGLAWGFAYQYCDHQKTNLNKKEYHAFIFGNFAMSWLGSKAFFLLFSSGENTSLYLESSNFWLGGGFVFYGGLVFCLLFNYLFLAVNKKKLYDLMPFLPALPMAHAIGRLGCLLAGCCFGAVTDAFWGVHIHGEKLVPVQLLESVLCLGIGLYLRSLVKKGKIHWVFPAYLLLYAFVRFILEFFRADEVRGRLGFLSSSQWVSLFLLLLAFFFVWKNSKEQSFS